jgi:hypothetical protein
MTLRTPELVDEFCNRIATGRSILSVASDPDMPEHSVIYRSASVRRGKSSSIPRTSSGSFALRGETFAVSLQCRSEVLKDRRRADVNLSATSTSSGTGPATYCQ